MMRKIGILALGALVASATLAGAAHAQSDRVARNQCFYVQLKTWCKGLEDMDGEDTRRCVAKHWKEMGPRCQHFYSDFKP